VNAVGSLAGTAPVRDRAPHHRAFLDARAVPGWVADIRGYFTARSVDDLVAVGYPESQARKIPTPGIVIPRFGLDGKPACWPKYRPDVPANRNDGRVQKYVFAAGSWNMLDALPDTLPRLASDEEIWLSAEGQLKADAMRGVGVLTADIEGIWSWRSQGAPLKAFEVLAHWPRWWHVICDSDFATSSDVPLAVCRLALHLKQLGGKVRVLHPPASDQKLGVDDFLARGGSLDGLTQVEPDVVRTVLRSRPSRPRAYAAALETESETQS
jgi:hypothetical protein